MSENFAKLLGSSTRANILEALARSRRPLSPYRIAKMYSMNVAKVYVEIKRLANLDLVSPMKQGRGLEYKLSDGNLRALALKLSPRTLTYDDWRSSEAKARRFRAGLLKVPKFSFKKNAIKRPPLAKPTRLRGELAALALLARSKFDKKYRRIGESEYARI